MCVCVCACASSSSFTCVKLTLLKALWNDISLYSSPHTLERYTGCGKGNRIQMNSKC